MEQLTGAGGVQGKENPHSLLMGWQTGTEIVDISMENSQKAKTKPII